MSSFTRIRLERARILLGLLVLGACQPDQGPMESRPAAHDEGTSAEAKVERPRVGVDSGLEILFVQTLDLDNDPNPEQVIVTMERSSAQSPMELLVIDHDPDRGLDYIAWRDRLAPLAKNSLMVNILDLTGDHRLEIVVLGVNPTGQQTIEIFRRSSDRGPALSFERIFSKAVNGVIRLEQFTRSETYAAGSPDPVSFPLVIEEADTSPEAGPLDFLRSTWIYSLQENTYVLSQLERISRREVSLQGAQDYSPLSTPELLERMQGLWEFEGHNGIKFELRPLEGQFLFYLEDAVELFEWFSTLRPRPNMLSIQGRNLLTLSKRIPLQVQLNLLIVNDEKLVILLSSPDDYLQGSYRRLAAQRVASTAVAPPFELVGEFLGDDGLRVEFFSPKIRWVTPSLTQEGSFALYRLRDWILQVRLPGAEGPQGQTRNYLARFQEVREAGQRRRLLNLIPVTLTVRGPQPLDMPPLRLQKLVTER